jgi:hypothetical protein
MAEEAELMRGRDGGAEREREQFSRLAGGRVELTAVYSVFEQQVIA